MLTAQDIMTSQVHTVHPDTDLRQLSQKFQETQVSAMPVMDDEEQLVGIVTETDLVDQNRPLHLPTVVSLFDWVIYLESQKNFYKELERLTAQSVGDICQRDVVTCAPETSVEEIASIMVKHKVHLLPVVADNRLLGVVARLDVIRATGG